MYKSKIIPLIFKIRKYIRFWKGNILSKSSQLQVIVHPLNFSDKQYNNMKSGIKNQSLMKL
jgi:hypothetical protein